MGRKIDTIQINCFLFRHIRDFRERNWNIVFGLPSQHYNRWTNDLPCKTFYIFPKLSEINGNKTGTPKVGAISKAQKARKILGYNQDVFLMQKFQFRNTVRVPFVHRKRFKFGYRVLKQMQALFLGPTPPPQYNAHYFGYNVKKLDIALYSRYYVYFGKDWKKLWVYIEKNLI